MEVAEAPKRSNIRIFEVVFNVFFFCSYRVANRRCVFIDHDPRYIWTELFFELTVPYKVFKYFEYVI